TAARLPGGSDGLLDRLHGRFSGLEVVQLGQPPQPPAYAHGEPAALPGEPRHAPLPEVRADVGEQRPSVVPVDVSRGTDHGRPPCPEAWPAPGRTGRRAAPLLDSALPRVTCCKRTSPERRRPEPPPTAAPRPPAAPR